jgi:hypothetical protein
MGLFDGIAGGGLGGTNPSAFGSAGVDPAILALLARLKVGDQPVTLGPQLPTPGGAQSQAAAQPQGSGGGFGGMMDMLGGPLAGLYGGGLEGGAKGLLSFLNPMNLGILGLIKQMGK